jgi:CheY-like chemotaxis protein
MPGETLGFVLNLIHQSPRPPRILVLIPYSSLVLKERCLDAGADYVFTKTADLDRIVEVLQKLAAERGEKE